MISRAIYLLCSFSLALAMDTCVTPGGSGPCIGNMCPSPDDTCINNDFCCSNSEINVPTTTTAATTTAAAATTQTTACNDVAGNCNSLSYLCENSQYRTLMTQQCGATCGRCSGTATTTSSTTCVDKLNPNTGRSDCPGSASLCNDSRYYTLMTQQCPRTCGRCPGAATTTSSSACVDKLNPNTGRSDCPGSASLCNDSRYYTLMTQQCPRTCGRC
ncbi:unnamed protein product [Auanema sp. JU1783]|nr:unnamed protein product [Auanema sp. JU1783]